MARTSAINTGTCSCQVKRDAHNFNADDGLRRSSTTRLGKANGAIGFEQVKQTHLDVDPVVSRQGG